MANILDSLSSLSTGRRVSLVGFTAVIVALTIIALFWITAKDYQVLFGDLEARQAAKVVAELERLKINYQLAETGEVIMVPAADVHEVRLKLMGSDVPLSGGVGFEIFDDSDFGMTDFAQRINYQRALEGELTRTIMSLKEVKYARVHLVMPDKGLFQQDDSPPSASVTLFLSSPLESLEDTQIAGIQRLISAAVPNLQTSQVTVSDQAGVTLSQQVHDQAGIAAVSGRLQQKQAIESYLAKKVRDVLAGTFGAEQAMVSVDVTLNFSEVKRTHENVLTADDGDGGVVRRRETRVDTGTNTSNSKGNVTTEIEYKLGRMIEQIVETPGEIRRLSVGVMVPADTTEARREEIRKLVEMVVGLDRERGDGVAVFTMDKLIATQAATPEITLALADEPPSLSATVSRQPVSSFQQWLKSLPTQTRVVAAAVLTVLLSFGLYLIVRKPRHSSGNAIAELSAEERDAALQKLQGWLDRPGPVDVGEKA